MYRKLMFLISLVALLVLTNGTFAAEIKWDGGGVGDSFCTDENWDGDVAPGAGDRAEMEYRGDGENTVVVDCAVVLDDFRMPSGGDPCLTVVNIVTGGSILTNGCRIGDDYSVSEFNISGTGSFIATTGEAKVADEGDSEVFWNISDNGYVEFQGKVRMGDGGGNVAHVNISGGTLNIGDDYWRLGDDGGGDVTISGGSVNVNGDVRWICRDNSQTITHTGGEFWCDGDYRAGEDTNGSKTCDVTVSGGIINSGELQIGGGDGPTTWTQTGGLAIGRDKIQVRGNAQVDLNGGVLQGGNLEIDGSSNVNIENDGALILDGNKLGKIGDLVSAGKLTGCGSARGIIADYGVSNAGKTTVTGIMCPPPVCPACCPDPPNGATAVRPGLTTGGLTLCWIEGDCLGLRGRNGVYFGTDEAAVTDANQSDPEWKGYQRSGLTTYVVGNLPLWETFYWRIDQFNSTPGKPPETKGETWSFTTGCELIEGDLNMDCLVNFLDFAELASTFGEEDFWPE